MNRHRLAPPHFLVGSLILLAACGDATGPLPIEGPPEVLEFSISSYGIGSDIWELRGDTVVSRHIPWEGVVLFQHVSGDGLPEPDSVVRVVPTADAWREFWARARRAGIRNWRGRYVAEGIIDGAGWSLEIAADGFRIESDGSNAYPDQLGRENEGFWTGAF